MSDLSEFRVNYSSPKTNVHSPKTDLPHSRSYNRHTNLTINKNDLSYQDLKSEYSKVLTYVDSVRNDRSYCKSPVDAHLDRKTYSGLLSSPSASGVISPNRGKGQTTYSRSSDSEKKIIELEQEVSELKKFLDASNARVTALQQENRAFQEKIQSFKDVDHCNKQLGYEIKALDSEIVSVTKKMKEVELENARLLAERRNHSTDDPISKDAMRNLSKYANYILYLLGTQESDHFSKFCFEERFNTQRDLLRLIEEKDKDKLLVQSFRYVADLLLNISSTAKASNSANIITPRNKGQAYLVDLSQTYNAVPINRAMTPNPQSMRKDSFTPPPEPSRNQRKSFQGSASESRHIHTESNDDYKSNYAREYEHDSIKRNSQAGGFSEDRKYSSSSQKYQHQEPEHLHERPPLSRDSRHHQEKSRKNSDISVKSPPPQYQERERLYCPPDTRFNKSAEPTHSHSQKHSAAVSHKDSFIREQRKYSDNDLRRETTEEEEEESFRPNHSRKPQHQSEYERESAHHLHNSRIENDVNYSSVRSPSGQQGRPKQHSFGSGNEKRSDSGYAEKVLKQNVNSELLKDIKRQESGSNSKYYEEEPSKRSSQERFINKDIRYNESTPKLRTECDDFTQHYEKDSSRRIVTEDIHYNYDDEIPNISKQSSKNSRRAQPAHSTKSNASSSAHHLHHQKRSPVVQNYNDDSELSQSREYESYPEEQQYLTQKLNKKTSPSYKSQKSDISSHTSPKDSRKPSSNLIIPKGSQTQQQASKKSSAIPKTLQSRSPSALSYTSNDYESLSESPLQPQYQEPPRSKSKSKSSKKPVRHHDSDEEEEELIEDHRPVPIAAHKAEIIYDELKSVASNQSGSRKQASPTGYPSPQSKIASVQDRIPTKSPSSTSKTSNSKPIVPVLKAKGKEKSIPSISTSQPMQNNSATAMKMTSPTNNSVSQIVYTKKKSGQNVMSSVQSAKSIGTASSNPKIRSSDEESTTPAHRDADLVKREQELIQRIRDLKEKEREIMEKEKEINSKGKELRKQLSQEQDQSPQPQSLKNSRYVNIKESYASIKSPKHDAKFSKQSSLKSPTKQQSAYREQDEESDQNIEEDSIEHREYPTRDRQEINHQDGLDSSRLKSILKKTNSNHENPHLSRKESYVKANSKEYNSNETLGYSSALRSSGDEKREADEFNDYETTQQSRGRGKGVSVSSPDEHSPEMYKSSKNGSIIAALESNHHKRLTFGTESNFDNEFGASPDLYSAERNEFPFSESRGSPSKTRQSVEPVEKGTNYPSFKVAFGVTESKFKRSQSPNSKIPSIIDVPRKGKAGKGAQTYDVIRGKELKNKGEQNKVPELEITPNSNWHQTVSQTTFSEISEINRGLLTDHDRISVMSPEKNRPTVDE